MVSDLNPNLNVVNLSQKLIEGNSLRVSKWSSIFRVLNDDETENLTKINFIQPRLFKNKITPISVSYSSKRSEFNSNIAILID